LNEIGIDFNKSLNTSKIRQNKYFSEKRKTGTYKQQKYQNKKNLKQIHSKDNPRYFYKIKKFQKTKNVKKRTTTYCCKLCRLPKKNHDPIKCEKIQLENIKK
jgi:hypothetical protein